MSTNNSHRVKLLKSNLNLNDDQITRVFSNDTLTDQVILSLKDSLSPNLIRKHLDPFLEGSYTAKAARILLRLQTRYNNKEFELASKKESVNFPKFDNFKDLEVHIDKVDSILKKPIILKRVDSIKKDSTKIKKKQ